MDKTFDLQINVINGEFKEFPQTFHFRCNELVPVGETIIRYFDEDMCSVAHKTFYLRKGENLFGTNQFKTWEDFYNYQYNVCVGHEFELEIFGCNVYLFGQKMLI